MASSADDANRAMAIWIIGVKKEGSLETCKAIAANLAHKKDIIRVPSVFALGQIAANNKTTIGSAMNLIPDLLRLLDSDQSLHVQKAAAEALGAVGVESSEALKGLIQVVEKGYDPRDQYGKVKVAAIEALGKFGEAASAAVPSLREHKPAGHQADESQIVSYEALLRIAPKNRDIVNEALPKMIAHVQSVFVPVRGRYAHIKNAIGHSHCQLVPKWRCRAIKALGTVEPDREKRVLALVKSLWMDESAENRQAAAESLQRVDHELAVEAGVIECVGLCEEGGKS